MKARLRFWQKAILQERYLLEVEMYEIEKSDDYQQGIKYGFILMDLITQRRVLMDNHHPKGPHIHLDDQEIPYEFIDEDKLFEDFTTLALRHLGVML
jgi:hypothetical protein